MFQTNNRNHNDVYYLTQIFHYILYKFYTQTELTRLIELLMLQIYYAETTNQILFIQYSIQTRDNIYKLLVRFRELKTKLNQILTNQMSSNRLIVFKTYLLNFSSRSRPVQYSPEQLKVLLTRLKQLIQSNNNDEPVIKKHKI
jgi:hypothetical protein